MIPLMPGIAVYAMITKILNIDDSSNHVKLISAQLKYENKHRTKIDNVTVCQAIKNHGPIFAYFVSQLGKYNCDSYLFNT